MESVSLAFSLFFVCAGLAPLPSAGIKNLWSIYAQDDPNLKKEEQKPVEDRKIDWDAFVRIDRMVVETVGPAPATSLCSPDRTPTGTRHQVRHV